MTILLATTGWDVSLWLAAFKAQAPQREILTPDSTELSPSNTVLSPSSTLRSSKVRYACVWKPPAGLLAGLPNLEVIVNLGAGVDAILADPTIPKHIPIIRSLDHNITMRMTEWVVLQVLYQHRQMPAYLAQQRQRVWRDLPQEAASAVTVGIMGAGVLGQRAATILKALGFDVIGWSRTAKPELGFPVYYGDDGLGAFLGLTDILVCLLPLTPETTGLLNYELLRRLKRHGPLGGPVLINGGRGKEQVAGDILRALDDGTLTAATLDVFDPEPLPATSPLWLHPKLTITPHVAADSDPGTMTAYVLGQLARHEAGQPMDNVVERARGY